MTPYFPCMISVVFRTKSGSTSIFYLLPGFVLLYVNQNFVRFGSQICCRLQANDCLSTAESKHFVWSVEVRQFRYRPGVAQRDPGS